MMIIGFVYADLLSREHTESARSDETINWLLFEYVEVPHRNHPNGYRFNWKMK